MTGAVTIDTALNQQAKTQSTAAKLNEDFLQFLTLLTTQLQNQDPLSPMDTNEFTNQLVQFSQVEQQINSNQKLDSILQLQLSNNFSSSLQYVGMDINYLSSEFNFDGTSPVEIDYALSESAMDSRLFIVDENGEAVYSQEAGETAGSHSFTWDGKTNGGVPVEPGTYKVRIDARNYDDEAIESTTVVSGKVDAVETQNGQVFLVVGERAISLSNVLKAGQTSDYTMTGNETTEEEET